MKNKKRTRITFNLKTKNNKQLPLFMIIKEYYDEQGEIEFAKVLFEIKGRKYRNLIKKWRWEGATNEKR